MENRTKKGITLIECRGGKEESKCSSYIRGFCFSKDRGEGRKCYYHGREVFITLEERSIYN